MAQPEMRWVRAIARGHRARSLRQFSLPTAEVMMEAATESVPIDLPDLSEFASPLSKAHFLLDTAAEIEHALMVQYLYSAFSLRSKTDPGLSTEQKAAVDKWRSVTMGIAKEEMGHLMTVQNLLIFIRQAPNLEREDFPPRKGLYPFTMNLEPLSQKSLAKFVVAESPSDAADIQDIVDLATGPAGMAINHVGILYAILGVVFSRPEDLDANAAGGDSWFVAVREIAHKLFETFPEQPQAEWHLRDSDFDPATVSRQASDGDWARGTIRVFVASNRADCLAALRDIGMQGEGPSTVSDPGDLPSHFERFFNIYRGGGGIIPFPVEGDWLPTIAIPTNPIVDESSNAPDAISGSEAVQWARLADLRYAILLGLIQEYFFWPTDDRDWLVIWCISQAMPQLRKLSGILTSRNRHESSMLKAALPFTLPIVVNLPADTESRVALHRRRFARSIQLATEIIAGGQELSTLNGIKASDEAAIAKLGGMPIVTPANEGATDAALPTANMVKLIEFLKSPPRNAANFHFGVEIDGGLTLADLFADPEQALNHLATKNVVNDEGIEQGNKLVVAGDPDNSAFFRLIQRLGHPMKARFALTVPETRLSPAEADLSGVEIVRNWIQSLV